MPPWALAAEMEESPTATRPRYEVAVATPVRDPEELVAAMGSDTLAYTSPVGWFVRPPQLQSRAEDESRMRRFFIIGFQLIGLTGLLLMGGFMRRHATADAQKGRPVLTDSEFRIRIEIPASSLSLNGLEKNYWDGGAVKGNRMESLNLLINKVLFLLDCGF